MYRQIFITFGLGTNEKKILNYRGNKHAGKALNIYYYGAIIVV